MKHITGKIIRIQAFFSRFLLKYSSIRITVVIGLIVNYYSKGKRFIIISILYVFVDFVLNLDIGKPEGIGPQLAKRITSNLKSKPAKYPYPTLDPELPKALTATETRNLDYLKLLSEAADQGKPIYPVKHQKPIDHNICCPNCGAPASFIYSNAFAYSKSVGRIVQKYKCKICERQWFPFEVKHLRFLCPFCRSRLHFVKARDDYDVFRCRNDSCPYLKSSLYRYHFRSPHFDLLKLSLASPTKPKIDLSKSHHPTNVISLAFCLHVNYQLDLRLTASFLYDIFGISLSHQTIANWCDSLAHLLFPLVNRLPLKSSGLFAVDETFEKYCGKWGYLCACIDGPYRSLFANHFSTRRNAIALITTIMAAVKRIDPPRKTIRLVHDYFPAYFTAIQIINQATDYHIISCPVKGLKDLPPNLYNPYRKYKNICERFFGIIKGPYYRTRGFGSVNGAVVWNTLQGIHYNYFRPHEHFDYQPPIRIEGLKSNNPIAKWNHLMKLATSSG